MFDCATIVSHERTLSAAESPAKIDVNTLALIIYVKDKLERELLLPIQVRVSLLVAKRVAVRRRLMKKMEWIREALSAWPSPEYVNQRETAGWRIVAVEWEREVQVEPAASAPVAGEEIPYGTRVANDCLHLEENPTEMRVLNHLAEMVVQDVSYNRMAESLNQHAFRTRDGKPWTALAVFKLTPRLIEVAPRILSGSEWENRKRQLSRVAWNS